MAGKLEPRVADSGANPVAALSHARVRQAHHREDWQAERHIDLDDDREGFDPEHRGTPEAGEHTGTAASISPAGLRLNPCNTQTLERFSYLYSEPIAAVA